MKIKLSLALALLPVLLSAQEHFTVKGRIINGQGEAVEYVQVGVPKLQIGTISTADGRFEIDIPGDTLEFFHVSYQTASYPVTGSTEDVVIVLQEQELPPAVFIGGNTKEKYLLRPGANVLKNMGIITTSLRSEHPSGRELGSVARAKKQFEAITSPAVLHPSTFTASKGRTNRLSMCCIGRYTLTLPFQTIRNISTSSRKRLSCWNPGATSSLSRLWDMMSRPYRHFLPNRKNRGSFGK